VNVHGYVFCSRPERLLELELGPGPGPGPGLAGTPPREPRVNRPRHPALLSFGTCTQAILRSRTAALSVMRHSCKGSVVSMALGLSRCGGWSVGARFNVLDNTTVTPSLLVPCTFSTPSFPTHSLTPRAQDSVLHHAKGAHVGAVIKKLKTRAGLLTTVAKASMPSSNLKPLVARLQCTAFLPSSGARCRVTWGVNPSGRCGAHADTTRFSAWAPGDLPLPHLPQGEVALTVFCCQLLGYRYAHRGAWG